MIVQGALDLLVGMGMVALGAVIIFGGHDIIANDPDIPKDAAPPDAMFTFVALGYLAIGGGVSLIGGLNVYAGIRNWMFKSRIVGIVAMFLGLGTLITCYCLPTSLALLVYGLIVYLNPAVASAFEMRARGYPDNNMLAAHAPTPNQTPPPPP